MIRILCFLMFNLSGKRLFCMVVCASLRRRFIRLCFCLCISSLKRRCQLLLLFLHIVFVMLCAFSCLCLILFLILLATCFLLLFLFLDRLDIYTILIICLHHNSSFRWIHPQMISLQYCIFLCNQVAKHLLIFRLFFLWITIEILINIQLVIYIVYNWLYINRISKIL